MSADMEAPLSVQDGDINPPRIEFLYFAACPNAPAALTLLRDVLREEGISSEIEMIAVETEEAAQRYKFLGSPTIRINGVDISPPRCLLHRRSRAVCMCKPMAASRRTRPSTLSCRHSGNLAAT